MSSSSRLTDLFVGICCCHPPVPCIPMAGQIITVSPNCVVNSLGQGRLTDIVIGGCGHPGVIVSGSPNVNANSLSKAFITSSVVGCLIGTIVTGSPNYNLN